jgi:hypothetical protein
MWRQSIRVVVWWGATVEIQSALCRLNQQNHINAKGLQLSLNRLKAMRGQWREVLASEKVREIAEDLPQMYGLRVLDSFQLAAALVWCKEKPKGRLFISDDIKLKEAAERGGFEVKP